MRGSLPIPSWSDEVVIVAQRQGRVVGFIHLANEKEPHEEDLSPGGIIKFLSYEPGCRDAGQQLLDAAEARFREHGLSQIYAFLKSYSYRFYVGAHGVCDRQGHVIGLFGVNGYRTYRDSFFMDCVNFDAGEPVLPDTDVEVCLHETPGRGDRPNLHVEAYRKGERFGVCATTSLAHRHPVDALQDTFYVIGMGVDGHCAHGKPAIEHKPADSLGMPDGIGDRIGAALRDSHQRKACEPNRIDHRRQVVNHALERDLRNVPV